MNLKYISKIRLASQQIAFTEFKSPKEIVSWMGAMQAQDFNMAKWAIGVRLPGTSESEVHLALDKGEILRVHILRPTWHFVDAEDIHWMVELTAPHMKVAMRGRHKQLELDEKIFAKSNSIIEKALAEGKHLTREEIKTRLEKAKISTTELRLIHLMYYAELSGIVCNGKMNGNNQTYALLQERIKKRNNLSRDESLAKLAEKYFSSHGPATISDFIWWSGLRASDAKNAFEMIKKNFISIKKDSNIYWVPESQSDSKKIKSKLYLLPAFDEFLVSYKDRTESLQFEDHRKTVSTNGIFRPVILLNGKVIGLWKRSTQKNKVIVEPEFFRPVSNHTIESFKKESNKYGRFLGKKIEIKI